MRIRLWNATIGFTILALTGCLLGQQSSAIALAKDKDSKTAEQVIVKSDHLTSMENAKKEQNGGFDVMQTPKKDRDNIMRSVNKFVTILGSLEEPQVEDLDAWCKEFKR